MNLILHHLRKDIRLLRWLLSLWGFVIVFQVIMTVLLFQPNYSLAKGMAAVWGSPFLIIATFVVWTLLLARLIQCEPVTGSTSFWLTRPVPPRVSIWSKTIFIFGFVILPSFIPALFFLYEFQSGPQIARDYLIAVLFFEIWGGIFIVWLTTYTPSVFHFAGLLCLGVLGFGLVVALTFSLLSLVNKDLNMQWNLFIPIIALGLFASLVAQYWKRRTGAGLTIGLVTFVIGFFAQIIWCLYSPVAPAPFAFHNLPTFTSGPPVHLDYQPGWEKTISWSRSKPTIRAATILKPVLPDTKLVPVIHAASAEFETPGEKPVPLTSTFVDFDQLRQLPQNELVQEAWPGYAVEGANHGLNLKVFEGLFGLNLDLQQKLNGKTGTLTLHLFGALAGYDQIAEIPLNDPGYIAHVSNGFIRVRPVDRENKSDLEVWRMDLEKSTLWYQNGQLVYVLIDPQARKATILTATSNRSNWGLFSASGNALIDSLSTLPLKGDEPLERMKLYIYRASDNRDFESTLTATNFTIKLTP